MMGSLFEILLFFGIFCLQQECWADDHAEDAIMQHIFNTHGTSLMRMPKEEGNETLTIAFGITPIRIDVQEGGVVEVFGWEKYKWKDYRLKWDPSSHGGIEVLRIDESKIWTPSVDWVLYNSIQPENDIRDRHMIILRYTGDVLWIPRMKRKILCSYDGSGSYDCKMRFGSWTRHIGLLLPVFFNDSKHMDLKRYLERNEYTVAETGAEVEREKYPCCAEVYPSITFRFTLARKSGYYNTAGAINSSLTLTVWLLALNLYLIYEHET